METRHSADGLLTRAECARLHDAGLIDYSTCELFDGQLRPRGPRTHVHAVALTLLVAWLRKVFGQFIAAQGVAIDLCPEDRDLLNEPEADAVVLTRSLLELSELPRPEELRLVAEVSDSTLAFDQTVKRRLYARSAIPEYWVLDLPGRRLIVHRQPLAGEYRSIQAYGEDERVATLASPAHQVRVGDLLG